MYYKSTLSNGIVVATETLPESHSVAMAVWLKTGSRDEREGEQGLCHMLEHMVFKGTIRKSAQEIAKELDSIGGVSDAVTGKESVCFYVKVLPKHLRIASEIILELLSNPRFDPTDLELERQVIFQELISIEESPEDYVYDLLGEAMFQGHPLGRPIIGQREVLQSVTSEDLFRFWDGHLYGSNILVSVSGKVSHQEVLEVLEPGLSPFKTNGMAPSRVKPVVFSNKRIQQRDLNQIHVALGFEAPSMRDEKRLTAALLNCILGGNMSSRLFQRVREKEGLVYSIYSSFYPYSDTGIFSIYFATEKEQASLVFRIIKEEIQTLLEKGVTEEELARAKDYSIAGIYLGTETPESYMFRNAKAEIYMGRYVPISEIEENINQVELTQIKGMAEEIFSRRPSVSAVGPVSEDELPEDL